jgi:hypothetical protein
MKAKRLLGIAVLFALVVGCGDEGQIGQKSETSQGCRIDRRGISGLPSDDDHSKALDVFIEECKKQFDETKVRDTIKLITIEWWDDVAPSPTTGQLNTVVVYNGQVYNGLTIGNLCKVAWRGKISRSAFVHEILHVIGVNILGGSNINHMNPVLRILETTINKKLIDQNL